MPQADEDDPLWTVQQIADFFQLKTATVRKWIREGKLEGIKLNGYHRVYRSKVYALAQKTYGEN